MTTPIIDPTFQPGWHVYGYTMTGAAYYGNTRHYPQQAIYGSRAYSAEIPGKNQEADMLKFIRGSHNPKTPYWKKGEWHLSTSPWPTTPDLCVKVRGAWAKRVVFYLWRGEQHIRRYRPTEGAERENLVPTMLKLMEAAVIWHTITDENKRLLTSEASRAGLRCHGWDYFTKLYIQNNPKWHSYV